MVYSRYRDIAILYRDILFIEQLLINDHTIFMQVEVALLGWRHKNKHIKCYRAREGGGRPGRGGGGGETLYIGTYAGIHVHE